MLFQHYRRWRQSTCRWWPYSLLHGPYHKGCSRCIFWYKQSRLAATRVPSSWTIGCCRKCCYSLFAACWNYGVIRQERNIKLWFCLLYVIMHFFSKKAIWNGTKSFELGWSCARTHPGEAKNLVVIELGDKPRKNLWPWWSTVSLSISAIMSSVQLYIRDKFSTVTRPSENLQCKITSSGSQRKKEAKRDQAKRKLSPKS